jgi:regulator of sirC expression with transglutaminase-like and TPR domain
MPVVSAARRRFAQLIQRSDDQLDLAEAALCIAWEDRGHADIAGVLRELDLLAKRVRAIMPPAPAPAEAEAAMRQVLFEELGLRGNTWRYGEPASSFLDEVLSSRAGLPITLSVIFLEVGWRVGLPVVGLALPGHFLVRYIAQDGDLIIDPFNRGRLWSIAECETQVRSFFGTVTPALMERVMEPPTRHAILLRMLRNLKNAYVELADYVRARWVVERILLVMPDDIDEVRDLGLLLLRIGDIAGALEQFERYARLAPHAADIGVIQQHADSLAAVLGRRN